MTQKHENKLKTNIMLIPVLAPQAVRNSQSNDTFPCTGLQAGPILFLPGSWPLQEANR